jgi:hypothetical protein
VTAPVDPNEVIGTKNGPRRSNRRYGNYRSLRHMYNDLKPDITYVAFYKRVVKGGMDPLVAAKAPKGFSGRRRSKPLPWEAGK